MAKKEETALDRLARLSEPSNEREFTLEEQMDSVSTDEFLDGMSLAAKDQLGRLFEEVKTDDDNTDSENTQPNIDITTPVMETSTPVSKVKEQSEIATDVTKEPPEESSNNSDELFINNTEKPKRKYTKRNTSKTKTQQLTVDQVKDTTSNPVFDQIVKDMIDELRNSKFKINRFDDNSMTIIYDYMYHKF